MNKNILIISRGFRAGDAITTLNLFSEWPKENLFCASLVDSDYTKNFKDFYYLGNKEVKYSFPFKHISHPKDSYTGQKKCNHLYSSSINSSKQNVYQRWVRPTLQWLDLYETRLTINLSPEFEKWIETIKPSVVYSSIGDIAIAKLLIKLHERFPKIKILVHGFDDWLIPSYKIWSETLHRKKAERLLRKILSFSSGRFTSSEKMAIEYQERYGYDFTCFPNPTDIAPVTTIVQRREIPNIVFTGKVGWHNATAIKEMVQVVENINISGTKILFDIYSQTPKSQINQLIGRLPKSTIVHSSIPNSEIPVALATSHILFLPISIDRQTSKFTRYSMSTKMGEYLASGVPMIYIGPEGIAMTEFLKEKHCAHVLTTTSHTKLQEIIVTCLSKDSKKLTTNGKRIAKEYFNKTIISRDFAERIKNILITTKK